MWKKSFAAQAGLFPEIQSHDKKRDPRKCGAEKEADGNKDFSTSFGMMAEGAFTQEVNQKVIRVKKFV